MDNRDPRRNPFQGSGVVKPAPTRQTQPQTPIPPPHQQHSALEQVIARALASKQMTLPVVLRAMESFREEARQEYAPVIEIAAQRKMWASFAPGEPFPSDAQAPVPPPQQRTNASGVGAASTSRLSSSQRGGMAPRQQKSSSDHAAASAPAAQPTLQGSNQHAVQLPQFENHTIQSLSKIYQPQHHNTGSNSAAAASSSSSSSSRRAPDARPPAPEQRRSRSPPLDRNRWMALGTDRKWDFEDN